VLKLAKLCGWLRDAWLLIGIAAVLFTLLEGSLSLFQLVRNRIARTEEPRGDWRAGADAYPERSWVAKYYQEFRASDGVVWRPYVYWRRRPYQGRYINVDRNGLRRTTAPTTPGQASARTIRIFMFGGSALWGTGARDDFTIPSILARELARNGLQAEVTNFGESGYVSTQEVIALMLRLQKGDYPDLVIFYDGVNDTFSAYQQHVAGLPQNEFNRVTEFHLSTDPDRLRAMALNDAAARLETVRLLGGLLGQTLRTTGSGPSPEVLNDLSLDNPPGAAGVAAAYFGNRELLQSLSSHFHFKCLLYWQPTIFQKTSLTRYEQMERGKARAFEQFFRKAYATVRQDSSGRRPDGAFRDLSLVFADVRQPMFVDWVHLGESGNEAIAKIMATDVVALGMARQPPAGP